jgi:hypothetical protein
MYGALRVTVLSVVLASTAVADTVRLADGRVIEGEVTKTAFGYEVKSKFGSVRVRKRDVLSIESSARPIPVRPPKRRLKPARPVKAGLKRKAKKPAEARLAAYERQLRVLAKNWLAGRRVKWLTKLVSHPNPTLRVRPPKRIIGKDVYSAKLTRRYKRRVPKARSLMPSRVGKAFWRYLARAGGEKTSPLARTAWAEEIAKLMIWRGQPLLLEQAFVVSVEFHRDQATVRFRAIPVKLVLCDSQGEHCPGRWHSGWTHDAKSPHPAFGFSAGERFTREPGRVFSTSWVLQSKSFALATELVLTGDALVEPEPEFAGAVSVAQWNKRGRVAGSTVADVGVVSAVTRTPDKTLNFSDDDLPDHLRVHVRVGAQQFVVAVPPGKKGTGVPVGARVVFRCKTSVESENRPARLRGREALRRRAKPTASVSGRGAVRAATR